MDPVEHAALRRDAGIVGNADQGGWRQVTLVAAAQWDQVMESLQAPLDPGFAGIAQALAFGLRIGGVDGDHQQKDPSSLDVTQESMPQSLPFVGTPDDAGDVRDDERSEVGELHDA